MLRFRDAWEWVASRWALSESLPPKAAVAVSALVLAAVVIPPVWAIARGAVTIVHEMSHVLVARLMGRRISGIRLHSDTSGLAISYGRPTGFGVLLTAVAGYPGPAVIGGSMTWAVSAGYGGAALTLLAALLVGAFLLVRNVWGVLTTVSALVGVGAVLWEGDAEIVTAVALGAGLFLPAGALRTSIDLLGAHLRRRAPESDAVTAAHNSLVPAMAWIVIFIAVAFAALVYAGTRAWELLP